jgi:TPP-dependent pyruvate/acetoin dehydrogenase alpha subunit
MTKEDLIAFEEDIAQSFNNKEIRAPIHLYNGNEDEMLKVFSTIQKEDWVFCSWRSHYQCLLKGVPPTELKQAIKEGKSISLCFPQYRIFSSAIVTGVIPIALGTALAIKRVRGENRVHCFVGEMTSETGSFNECLKYAVAQQLPIRFIVEDNGKSVCTDTRKTWNTPVLFAERSKNLGLLQDYLYYYRYETKWPHAGSGSRIQF